MTWCDMVIFFSRFKAFQMHEETPHGVVLHFERDRFPPGFLPKKRLKAQAASGLQGGMGTAQSEESKETPKDLEEEKPREDVQGRVEEAEVDLKKLKLEKKSPCERHSGQAVPFLLVIALSTLVKVPEGLDVSDAVSASVLMCSSWVAGFAGAFILSRASTWHAKSTAGFLLCTWAVGLSQTTQQGTKLEDYLADVNSMPVGALVEAFLRAIQIVWLLYLPLQRLESLQSTASHEFIAVQQLKRRVWWAGLVYAFMSLLHTVLTFLNLEIGQKVTQVFLQMSWFYILFVYGQILTACSKVYSHLDRNMKVVEISNSTAASYKAFRVARRAILLERWGLRACFVSTVLVGPIVALGFDIFAPRSRVSGWLRGILLLVNTIGAWFLSNAHGLLNLSQEACIPAVLMTIIVLGLLVGGLGFSKEGICFVSLWSGLFICLMFVGTSMYTVLVNWIPLWRLPVEHPGLNPCSYSAFCRITLLDCR